MSRLRKHSFTSWPFTIYTFKLDIWTGSFNILVLSKPSYLQEYLNLFPGFSCSFCPCGSVRHWYYSFVVKPFFSMLFGTVRHVLLSIYRQRNMHNLPILYKNGQAPTPMSAWKFYFCVGIFDEKVPGWSLPRYFLLPPSEIRDQVQILPPHKPFNLAF